MSSPRVYVRLQQRDVVLVLHSLRELVHVLLLQYGTSVVPAELRYRPTLHEDDTPCTHASLTGQPIALSIGVEWPITAKMAAAWRDASHSVLVFWVVNISQTVSFPAGVAWTAVPKADPSLTVRIDGDRRLVAVEASQQPTAHTIVGQREQRLIQL